MDSLTYFKLEVNLPREQLSYERSIKAPNVFRAQIPLLRYQKIENPLDHSESFLHMRSIVQTNV